MLRRDFIGFASVASNAAALLPRFQPSLPLESFMRRPNSSTRTSTGYSCITRSTAKDSQSFAPRGRFSQRVFGQVLPELAKTRKVLAVHLQGHGHTKDINRALRFEFMADDIAALLAYLKISKADVLGYSLGGGVALQTIIRHPAVVNRLVVIFSSHETR